MARHFSRVVALTIFFKTCMLCILLIKYSSKSVIYFFIYLLGKAPFSFMPHTNVSAVMMQKCLLAESGPSKIENRTEYWKSFMERSVLVHCLFSTKCMV